MQEKRLSAHGDDVDVVFDRLLGGFLRSLENRGAVCIFLQNQAWTDLRADVSTPTDSNHAILHVLPYRPGTVTGDASAIVAGTVMAF